MGAGLIIGGLVVGGAVLTGHGDDLLAFGQKALGKLGEILQGLFGNEYVPDKDPTGTRENEEKIANDFVDGNKIKTDEELNQVDVFAQYDMEQNVSDNYVAAFSNAAGQDLNNAQKFFSDIPIVGKLFESEAQRDAKTISQTLAHRCGIVALDGDTKLNATDSADKIYDKAFNALSNFPEDGDMDEAMKEISEVLGIGMDDSEHSATFTFSADRAVMGNDTYEAAYNYINDASNKVLTKPGLVDRKKMANSIADSMIEKRGLPIMEGKSAEEARAEVVDGIYDAINQCNYTNPLELSMHMSDNLSAKGITFEKQAEIIENFKSDRASGKFNPTDVGDKRVSSSLAEGMTTPTERVQPTSVDQATTGAKETPKEEQKADKTKGTGEIEK